MSTLRLIPVLLLPALLMLLGACKSEVSDNVVVGDSALAPPSNLSATAAPDGQSVLLSWTDNATAETGYRLEASDIPITSVDDVTAYLDLPAGTTSTPFATNPGSNTYFRVLAVTATHQSKPSALIMVHTPAPPIQVMSLSATTVSTSQIDLSWWDISNETGYRLERNDEIDPTWIPLVTLGADTTTYSDTGLVATREYCYRLIAFNGDGESGPGNTACATTLGLGMTITTAATAGDVGYYTSLALDTSGYAHVSHHDSTANTLVYTTNAGGSFTTTVADYGPLATSQVGTDGTSIGLDGSGFVHIAAVEYNNGDLRYTTNTSGSLVSTSIDTMGFVGHKPVLKIHPPDQSIHIVYIAGQSLKYATKPLAGSWSFEVFTGNEFLGDLDFALDSSGFAHVTYVRWVDAGGYFVPELVYTNNTSGSWSSTVVPTPGDPDNVSIAADSGGTPHIVFNDDSTQGLHYRIWTGSTWQSEIIDQTLGVWVGRYNSIAIETAPNAGRIHVSYQDRTNMDLKYARKDPGTSWVRRTVDSTGTMGAYTSIALDSSGMVHISYQDEGARDLKVASGTP